MNTATLRSKGLYGVLQQLSRLTPEQLAKIFPDIRGFSAITQLVSDMGGLKEDLDAMEKKADSAAVAFERMSGLVGTAIAQVWQSIKAVSDELGESLGPLIKDAGEWAVKSAKSFAEWVKEHRDLVVTGAKVAIGLAAVRDAREKGLDVTKVEEQYKLKDRLLDVRAAGDALGPLGTFSSRAAGMLGAGSTATRIEENTKRTAEATEKIANRRDGLAWGS
jgi:hypothetical protein